MTGLFRSIAILLLGLAVSACVEKAPEKKVDPAYIEKNILDEPPATMDHTVNANLGGKVVYLGNDVSSDTIAPGDKVEIIHYWKVIAAPGGSWRVFAHLVGNTNEWMNVDYTDMRVGYPPSKWKAGEIIRDEQTFTLKKSWKSSFAELRVGLYRKGGQGIADRMAITSGPKDSQRRVVAIRFAVGDKPAPSEQEDGYVVRKTAEPITIDGKADEAAWKSATQSPAFTTAEGGRKVTGETTARLLWDDENLYALVEVADTDVYTEYDGRDEPLWKQDVVELFIDADKSGAGYVELQVNPKNAQFDAYFPRTRAQPSNKKWSAEMTSAVVVAGTVDNRDDEDTGYTAEIAIPLAAVRGESTTMKVNIPPKVGDTWKLNVVRVDGESGDDKLSAATWNPITIQDFHALDRMLTVTFGDAKGGIEPPPAATNGASPPAEAKPVLRRQGKVQKKNAKATPERVKNPFRGEKVKAKAAKKEGRGGVKKPFEGKAKQ